MSTWDTAYTVLCIEIVIGSYVMYTTKLIDIVPGVQPCYSPPPPPAWNKIRGPKPYPPCPPPALADKLLTPQI